MTENQTKNLYKIGWRITVLLGFGWFLYKFIFKKDSDCGLWVFVTFPIAACCCLDLLKMGFQMLNNEEVFTGVIDWGNVFLRDNGNRSNYENYTPRHVEEKFDGGLYVSKDAGKRRVAWQDTYMTVDEKIKAKEYARVIKEELRKK